ncbi:shikimate dehydrogenase [Luteococcus peritonei]|uniref:Shikimate dehydrogenase n=1 Tax=Luteococcus peritonei TaxID=88874 RepID=A0ABW4S1A8_9ACTN
MPGLTEGVARAAVIGHPVAHSLSPALHRAAHAQLGLDWHYEAIDVEPGGVDGFLAGLDEFWRGLSVTMPHKEAIRRHGSGDELVELTGVANTWVRIPGAEPLVRNTDVGGYQLALSEAGIGALDSAVVVGNGATARSAVVALRQLGVERVQLLARDPQRAQELRGFCSNTLGMLCKVSPLRHAQVIESDILVSTVPAAGVEPVAEELAAAVQVVFDSVYDPWPTALARAAEARGRLTLNGLDLLAGQAVEQVRLMTGGGEVGYELLRSAGQEALGARGAI